MVIGGRLALRLAPRAIRDLAGDRVWALVSATNGKTSLTRLLVAGCEQAGPITSQPTGANMSDGIVSALSTGPPGAPAVLEVDEAYLPLVLPSTRPRCVVLGNLSRDQLDRMNEVAMIARKWRAMLDANPGTTVIANCDDPVVSYSAENTPNVVWVAVGQTWTVDSTVCVACGKLLKRDGEQWSCPGCGRERPRPDWRLVWHDRNRNRHGEHSGTQEAVGPAGIRLDLSQLRLPGRFNAANATLALAACQSLGLDLPEALRRMAAVESVSGRYAILDVGARRIRLWLAKNPAGWSELIDVMPPPPQPVIITINANSADGRDPSWLWDVPFEKLRGRKVIATGNRRRDLAVRLLHAQVHHVVVEDPYRGDAPLPPGVGTWPVLDCATTYTAFQALRRRAAREAATR